MVLAVGRAAENAKVPVLDKKSINQIVAIYNGISERSGLRVDQPAL
jgi:hypothetical protein